MPDAETVVVPVGGGGLAAGIALALGGDSRRRRWSACAPRPTAFAIADGIAVKQPGELTGPILDELLDDVVEVSGDEIAQAIVLLLERTKLVVEGAGAVGVAALLEGKIAGSGPVAVVLSGGNIDASTLITVMRHGLTLAGRHLVVRTRVPDRPGELLKLLQLVAEERVNVLSVEHRREGVDIPVGATGIELTLLTRDEEHCEALLDRDARMGLRGRAAAVALAARRWRLRRRLETRRRDAACLAVPLRRLRTARLPECRTGQRRLPDRRRRRLLRRPGGRVEGYLVLPPGQGTRPGGDLPPRLGREPRAVPAAGRLGGGTARGRDDAHAAVEQAGAAPSGLTPAESLARDRRIFAADVVAVRRAVDLLSRSAEVDPKRIGLVGWSLGARVAAVTAGAEPRPRHRAHVGRLAPGLGLRRTGACRAAGAGRQVAYRDRPAAVDRPARRRRCCSRTAADEIVPRAALVALGRRPRRDRSSSGIRPGTS